MMDIDNLFNINKQESKKSLLEKLGITKMTKLYDWQKELINELIEYIEEEEKPKGEVKRIAISGAFGTGKSSIVALLIPLLMMYLELRYPKQMIKGSVFSGSETQALQVIWGELSRMVASSNILNRNFKINGSVIYLVKHKEFKEIRLRTCSTTGQEHKVAGVHDDNVIVIVDEATLVSDEVFQKIQSFFTSGRGFLILSGNPIVTEGVFFRAFQPGSMWRTYTISRYDIAGREDKFSDRILNEYGENSFEYVTGVLGNFYLEAGGGLFPRYLLEESSSDHIPASLGEHVIGIDSASGTSRSSTGIVVRNLNGFVEVIKRKESTMSTIDFSIGLINRYMLQGFVHVVVDNNGIGDSVYTALQRHYQGVGGVSIYGIKAQTSAINNKSCANLKTELYYRLRDGLKKGLKLPKAYGVSEELFRELASIELVVGAQCRIKSKIRKENELQFDIADAASFTMFIENIEIKQKKDTIKSNFWGDLDDRLKEDSEECWL